MKGLGLSIEKLQYLVAGFIYLLMIQAQSVFTELPIRKRF